MQVVEPTRVVVRQMILPLDQIEPHKSGPAGMQAQAAEWVVWGARYRLGPVEALVMRDRLEPYAFEMIEIDRPVDRVLVGLIGVDGCILQFRGK